MTERVLTPPIEPITTPVRSSAVDIVKGIAIFLVVFEHNGQGMIRRGWWTGISSFYTDIFIYTFHMPAFFFVAGLFLGGSLHRRGAAQFTIDKLKTILYPYLLWALFTLIMEPLLIHVQTSMAGFSYRRFLISIFDGSFGWFLPVLFCCQMIAVCLVKVPGWVRLTLAVIAAILLGPHSLDVLHKTVWYFSFVAGGMLVGRNVFRLQSVPLGWAVLGAGALFALQVFSVLHLGGKAQFGPGPNWRAVLLGFTGTAGLLFIARAIDGTALGDLWAWLGRASIAIFLLAPYPQGFTRDLLVRFGHTHEFWLQLLVPTLCATLLPAIVWHQQSRWRAGWLFHWPSR